MVHHIRPLLCARIQRLKDRIFSGGMVPSFMLVNALGLVDTIWAMLIPGAMSTYNMIIARTYMINSIPDELYEVAEIDGCTPLQTFFKVVFPILKPTTVTVAILEAMWVWNDYLLPSLVLNINKYKTIPIAIQFLKQSHGQIDWGAMMAVLVLAILPIIIFYIACQKYIIEGVLAGAVKG